MEMEGLRFTIIAFMCVLLISQKRINGEEVEMKVRPGDNITLYCDRSLNASFKMVWIRNCSHENQPSLMLDFSWNLKIFQRYSFIPNRHSNSVDLYITNISVSDLGLYYCAEVETKVNKDKNGIISSSEIYYYGRRTICLSLEGPLNVTSTPPVSDCWPCWSLLFSVCPVCVCLFSVCVFCFCHKKTTDAASKEDVNRRSKIEGDDEEVCYASLDVKSRRQKQCKTKRVQCSDFSTYSQVRTETK